METICIEQGGKKTDDGLQTAAILAEDCRSATYRVCEPEEEMDRFPLAVAIHCADFSGREAAQTWEGSALWR